MFCPQLALPRSPESHDDDEEEEEEEAARAAGQLFKR